MASWPWPIRSWRTQQWPSNPGSRVDKREISRGSPGVGSTGRQGTSAKWFAGSALAVAHRRSTGHHRCLLAAVLPATTAAKALMRSPTAATCTVRGCHDRLLLGGPTFQASSQSRRLKGRVGCLCARKSGARLAPRPRSETDHVIRLGDETNRKTVDIHTNKSPS